jgi:hypothetical protein
MGRARAESRTDTGAARTPLRIYIAAVPFHPGMGRHRSVATVHRRPRAPRSKRTIARPSSATRDSGFHA